MTLPLLQSLHALDQQRSIPPRSHRVAASEEGCTACGSCFIVGYRFQALTIGTVSTNAEIRGLFVDIAKDVVLWSTWPEGEVCTYDK